jgi:hypothetical protein
MAMTLVLILIVIIVVISLYIVYHATSLANTVFHRRKLHDYITREAYFERFNKADIIARTGKGVTLDEYVAGCRAPSLGERIRLFKKTRAIVGNAPWRFMFFDPDMENGFPHTHGPYIMLPDIPNLLPSANTLLHENVHVWQRFNPCEANVEIERRYPDMRITGHVVPSDMHRANPDTNTILYGDARPVYTKDPTRLTDIVDARDHPYELMAYDIADQSNNEK